MIIILLILTIFGHVCMHSAIYKKNWHSKNLNKSLKVSIIQFFVTEIYNFNFGFFSLNSKKQGLLRLQELLAKSDIS